jgi:hypothetical protein
MCINLATFLLSVTPPVMNTTHFGNEFLANQISIQHAKPRLYPTTFLGLNIIRDADLWNGFTVQEQKQQDQDRFLTKEDLALENITVTR